VFSLADHTARLSSRPLPVKMPKSASTPLPTIGCG
jgi:hypothetical protein